VDYELRIVAEKVLLAVKKLSSVTLSKKSTTSPESIFIRIASFRNRYPYIAVQNILLAEQSILINPKTNACPNCGQKLKKNGHKESDFFGGV